MLQCAQRGSQNTQAGVEFLDIEFRKEPPFTERKGSETLVSYLESGFLFKAWRSPADLQSPEQTWAAAFLIFLESCPREYVAIINNMKLPHECKDNRFLRGRSGIRLGGDVVKSSWMNNVDVEADDLHGEETMEDILNRLTSIKETRSRHNEKVNQSVQTVLRTVDQAGLFTRFRTTASGTAISELVAPNENHKET